MDYIYNQIEAFKELSGRDCLEIFVLIIFMYYILKCIQETRMKIFIKGIFTFFVFYAIVCTIQLPVIHYLLNAIISIMTIGIIIVFQPELRRFIESLGTKKLKNFLSKNKQIENKTVNEIINSIYNMSEVKTGALIAIENEIPLDEYIQSGIPINADISKELIENIFEHNTPLHDGAMIIRNEKIVAATCYLPLSESNEIKKEFGTRHRSAIGLSEKVDATIIVVSEETGAVSVAKNGKLFHGIDKEELKRILLESKIENAPEKHHIKTKIFSVILGIFVWISLIAVINPTESKYFYNIPVTIINDDVITQANKSYDVISGDTVNIKVSAKRSVITDLTSDDFHAIANFSKISISNAVPIEVKSSKDVDIDLYENDVMNVSIDDTAEMECKVNIEKINEEADDVFYGNLTADINSVVIRGPKKLMKTVDKAVVLFDASKDYTTDIELPILLYDKNGTLITEKYSISNTTCIVSFEKMSKKEISLIIKASDQNAQYNVKNQSIDKIVVAGENKKLKIDSLTISIDISEAKTNKITSIVNLENYIPDGIYLTSDSNIELNFEIDKYIEETISIKPDKIRKDDNIQIKDENILIDLIYDKNIEDIEDHIEISIDTKDLDPGEYTVQPKINVDDGITIESVPSINIRKEGGSDK